MLIYASSDMGNPALHSTRNVPTVLAGGANGKFRMGRRIKTGAPTARPATSGAPRPTRSSARPATNNHLLVSIAQAFGVAIDSFGTQPDPTFTTGALSGLT